MAPPPQAKIADERRFAAPTAVGNNAVMARVFIGIGSNLGDRAAHLDRACQALATLPRTRLAARSEAYETEPVGPIPQGRYLNAAALIETDLDPYDLLDALHAVERDEGREPDSQRTKWGPRTLDLDILLYDQRVISSDELVVPHPLLHERWFALKPLADLDPKTVHPLLEMTVGELLSYIEQHHQPQESPEPQ